MKIRLKIRLKEIMLLTMYSLLLSSCDGLFNSDTSDTVTLHVSFAENTGSSTRTLSSSNEDAVNDITVLVFNSSGDLIGSGYNTFTTSPYTMDITTRVADGCTVYAIANTHNSSYFEGISTISALNAMNVTLTTAASLGTGSSDIIQSGEQTGVKITTSGGNISIAMAHLCSKMNFSIVPASGITITGYQLCNVSLGCYITDSHTAVTTSPGGYGNFDAVTLSSPTAGTTVTPSTYYVYENLAGSNTSSTTEALRTSANAPGNSSYLLVYATGGNWKSVYRIYLGGMSSTDYTNYSIPRNYNYPYTINIDGSGVSDVRVTCYPELINSASATSWGSNGSATAVTSSATATPGDYYYSDGTWGSLANNPGKTPIAVIFSAGISGSSAYTAGYTHGLAIALTDANGGNNSYWSSTYPTSAPSGNSQNIQTDNAGCNDLTSGYNGGINDGYGKQLQTGSISYYAYYYCGNGYESNGIAANPSNNKNSGWYLPSLGEIALLWKNLGGITPSTNSSSLSNSVTPGSTNYNAFVNYFTNSTVKAEVSGATAPVDKWYWSSSEYNSSYACGFLYCSSVANFGDDYKVNTNYGYYRSILAF